MLFKEPYQAFRTMKSFLRSSRNFYLAVPTSTRT